MKEMTELKMVYELVISRANPLDKEGAAIIVDNTQLTIFGGFAPNSVTAESMSKALGSRTVMSGSVSRSVNDPSQSLQMIERPLMTADELKSMPKGQFIVMKTGVYPMKVKLQLFFKWGIKFEEAYAVNERGNRMVKYASSKKLISSILEKYPHTSNKKNRPYAPPGEYSESSAPPVSVAILNAVKQELDKHKTKLKTQSTFAYLRDSIIDEK